MRREGRAHGMVRTYHVLPSPLNPRPNSRIINKIDSPPTAGLFTKISHKPTNHSKFTGKCEKARCSCCHLHPASKPKHKAKGVHKIKAADAALSYQQITMAVTGSGSGSDSGFGSSVKLRNTGYSASGILDELNIFHNHVHHHNEDECDYDDYDDYDDDGEGHETNNNVYVENLKGFDDDGYNGDDGNNGGDDDDVIIHAGVTDDGDDGYVGFYDVGYEVNSVVDDEGWSVVGGN